MKYEAVERMVVFLRDRVSTHLCIEGKEPDMFYLCADNWDMIWSWKGWAAYSRRLGKWAPRLFGAEQRDPVKITVDIPYYMRDLV